MPRAGLDDGHLALLRMLVRPSRLTVNSPSSVVELFGHTRYIAQMSVGAVAHTDVLRSIELFGTVVAPAVRAEVARRAGERAPVTAG